MRNNRSARLGKKVPWRRVVLTACAAVLASGVVWTALASALPLSQDEVSLLLNGGASMPKLVQLIKERGIDFRLTPALIKKFESEGASDEVIKALRAAPVKEPQEAPAAAGPSPPQRASAPSGSLGPIPGQPPLPISPEFVLTDLNGKRLDLRSYRGKVVLLDFWATWCPPCREEIPSWVGLETRYGGQGLQVIGVAVGDRRAAVEKFYQDYLMNYPVAMGNAQVRQAYGGLTALPTTFLIGRDGRIYARYVGPPSDLSQIEDTVRALLKGTLVSGPQIEQAAAPKPPPARLQASAVSPPASAPASSEAPPRMTPSSARPATAAPPNLSDPSPAQVQQIIQAFAAKEQLFKQARENYTYHQINKVETLDADDNPDGEWEQDWDVLFDDQGNRIERVTYAPLDNLKDGLELTEQDLDAFRNINPFVLTTDELAEYEIKYLAHVKVDYITAYVFSVRPREIQKGRQYFKGTIWVDDRDLQIVKAEGEQVPEINNKHEQNLFPRFTTYRQQIDGKYWFPTFTIADDTLYFSTGPVHIKEIIKYTDYKQFKSSVRILSVKAADQPKKPPAKP